MKKVIQNLCNYTRYERELCYLQTCKCFGIYQKYDEQIEELQAIFKEYGKQQ